MDQAPQEHRGCTPRVMESKQALQGEVGPWHISLPPDPDQGSPFRTGNRSVQLLYPTRHRRACTAHLSILGTTAKPVSHLPSLCSPSISSGQATTARVFLWDPSLPPAKQLLLAPPLLSSGWWVGWESHVFCIFSIILQGRDEHPQHHCCHSATCLCMWFLLSPIFPSHTDRLPACPNTERAQHFPPQLFIPML